MAQGMKTGGRQRGTPNKSTVERRLRAAQGLQAAHTDGLLPLDVMLARMWDKPLLAGRKVTDEQFQAAVAAAPYMHARLSAVAVRDMTPPDPVLVQRQDEARAQLVASLEALARPEPLTIEQATEADCIAHNTDARRPSLSAISGGLDPVFGREAMPLAIGSRRLRG